MRYSLKIDFETEEELNNIDNLLNGYLLNDDFKGEILKKTLTKSTQRTIKSKVIRLNKDINLKPEEINTLLKNHQNEINKEVLQNKNKIVTNINKKMKGGAENGYN
jgi:hypothetical protein